MATLQKFKLLAAHCVIIGSPDAKSPTSSPVINIRRRITLRMLLTRAGSSGIKHHQRREKASPDRRRGVKDKGNDLVVRQKLRDLFELSPPSLDDKLSADNRETVPATLAGGDGGRGSKRNGDRPLRPVSVMYRQRLMRRGWTPMLVTIPEEKY